MVQMDPLTIQRTVSARIPTPEAEFRLLHYTNSRDSREHIALVAGDVSGRKDVLVRVHSECFTGDVFGSLRCDCGDQLYLAMRLISLEGRGVVLYLRQEGRGIGLPDKLRAYNLQDMGYDTVDANLMLGHEADTRDYEMAALMLKDISVKSVRLLTNNGLKIDGLRKLGIEVTSHKPLYPQGNAENIGYLMTKVNRMGHLIELGAMPIINGRGSNGAQSITDRAVLFRRKTGRPFITLAYAQSLDGSIAQVPGRPMNLSAHESQAMTHRLRAVHNGILIGVGTVIADNPRLTVRLTEGTNPQPVILDSCLRFPLDANLLQNPGVPPWIVTIGGASLSKKKALEERGARVLCMPSDSNGWVDLRVLMQYLAAEGMDSVMVEGGSRVITSFLSEQLVDYIILTIAPVLVGGLQAVGDLKRSWRNRCPRLVNMGHQRLGDDLVIWGDTDWSDD